MKKIMVLVGLCVCSLFYSQSIILNADSWLGTKYKYGGVSYKGIDCSAFVRNVIESTYSMLLPRTSQQQFKCTQPISKKDLQVGDLVFFSNSKRVYHVGIIYKIEEDSIKFIHASSSKGVSVAELDKGYWSNKNQKYNRILK